MPAILRVACLSLVVVTVLLAGPSAGQVALTPRDVAALQQWTLNLEEYLVVREQAAQVAKVPIFWGDACRWRSLFVCLIHALRPCCQPSLSMQPNRLRSRCIPTAAR